MDKKFKLDSIYSNGMVLQRGVELRICGEAEENSIIELQFCNQYKRAIANNNRWEVKLSAIFDCDSGPHEMRVSCSDKIIKIKDILIGDVFIAAGQSNMQFMLKESLGGIEEIKVCHNLNIRYFNVPRIGYEDENERIPDLDEGEWVECNKENAGEFSAVAYYFAKNLGKSIDVPIGIIGCNVGGTSASCWISEKYLECNPDIKENYLDSYYEQVNNLSEKDELLKIKIYEDKVNEFNNELEKYKEKFPNCKAEDVKKNVGTYPWPPPMTKKCNLRPGGLYNTMVSKIQKYSVKAVLWYQGEEDTKLSYLYEKLLALLIKNWREDKKEDKLPFIIVQLPCYEDDKENESWADVRQAQLRVSNNTNDVYLVVTIDCGEKYDIHPVEKKTIGDRVALIVREKLYNEEIGGSAPQIKKIFRENDRIIIEFCNLYGGNLEVKGEEVSQEFEISEEELCFVKANAEVKENKILLYSDRVKSPKVVRYAWKNYVEINIYNNKNLPLSTFQTIIK